MLEKIVLGGGCFWCTEAAFLMVEGITNVVSGYSGGDTQNPSYYKVCSGNTGHAEVIEIIFDDKKISLEKILEIFWKIHDPTSLNKQGHDEGTQYRSAIFYTNEAQKEIIEKSVKNLESVYTKPIVTEITPLKHFYPAEEEHKDYFNKHPNQSYCQVVIQPKLAKLRTYLE